MKKNYYELLQVNQNATQEIIEKAFKVLAKKYHPDLQNEINKEKSAEIFKEINEAYQVLSDSEKREEYDRSLGQTISEEKYNALYNENRNLKNIINEIEHEKNQDANNPNLRYEEQNNLYNQQQQQANYYNNVTNNIDPEEEQRLINEYYRQQQKARIKYYFLDKLKRFVAIIIAIIIILLVLQIPFVKNYYISLYKDNAIIKGVVDAFINMFNHKNL